MTTVELAATLLSSGQDPVVRSIEGNSLFSSKRSTVLIKVLFHFIIFKVAIFSI